MRMLTSFHDADGLRTGLVYPGGNVLAAGYTARGQLATMTFHGQPVAMRTYCPNGQPLGTVGGNGAQRTLSYDAAGRLTGTGTNADAATIPPLSPAPIPALTVSGAAGATAISLQLVGREDFL
jgi:YD repeat-containing protein